MLHRRNIPRSNAPAASGCDASAISVKEWLIAGSTAFLAGIRPFCG
jgi:hypothetical protein